MSFSLGAFEINVAKMLRVFAFVSPLVRTREPLSVFLWNLVLRLVTVFCRHIQIADYSRTPARDTLRKKLHALLGVYF